jgi:hypothetical protein
MKFVPVAEHRGERESRAGNAPAPLALSAQRAAASALRLLQVSRYCKFPVICVWVPINWLA